jgi:hypothetical protein
MAKLSEKRKQLLRENRAMLKAAGFSAKEVDRYKGASRANVLKAIEVKQLPEIREEKRHRAKVKYTTKEFKTSKAKLRQLEDISLDEKNLQKIMKEFPKNYSMGYSYFYVRITLVIEDGTTEVLQTPMYATKDYTESEQLKSLINDLIFKFVMQYAIAIETIIVDIMFWKSTT